MTSTRRTKPSAGGRVLLVEDDDDLRAYLTRLLESDGWTVDAVADAESATGVAFDRTATSLPQVILTDVMLPGQSGLDLLITLRNAERTARVPIILLTARAGVEAAVEGLRHGADDYVTKPFSAAELLARVRVHHDLGQLREDAVGEAKTRVTQLRAALDSNRLIGTAIGIVISTLNTDAAQSFQVLVLASQLNPPRRGFVPITIMSAPSSVAMRRMVAVGSPERTTACPSRPLGRSRSSSSCICSRK